VLRRTHVAPFTRIEDGALRVDWLRDADGRVVAFLDRLLRLVRRLEGCPRTLVAEALRRQERRVRDAQRLSGIAKTALDVCVFRAPDAAGRALEMRRAVFLDRGAHWPPVPGDEAGPYARAGAPLGLAADAVRDALYADAPGATLLVRAPHMAGSALLDRYNLELARAVLFDAERLVLTARGGWRATFRAIKLARLMYRIERAGRTKRTYRVELTGPAARYIVRPQRYGVRMAQALPAFTRAPAWRIEADIVRGDERVTYRLDGSAPLPAPRRRTRYDSQWEQSLARDFAEKLGDERAGWTLAREDVPVAAGGELFLPDFTLRNADGREALVELLGFWTPDYLEAKARKIRAAGIDHLILVVFRGLAAGREAAMAELSALAPIVWFAEKPRIAPVLEAAERVARRSE
jgi:predicted nuclease of restriction endonuclease-like RecB superfamily